MIGHPAVGACTLLVPRNELRFSTSRHSAFYERIIATVGTGGVVADSGNRFPELGFDFLVS